MPGEEWQVSVLMKPPPPLTATMSRGFHSVRPGCDGLLTAQSRHHRGPKWITVSTHGSAWRRRPVKLASSARLVLVPNITTFLSLRARNSQDLVFWKAEESGKHEEKSFFSFESELIPGLDNDCLRILGFFWCRDKLGFKCNIFEDLDTIERI